MLVHCDHMVIGFKQYGQTNSSYGGNVESDPLLQFVLANLRSKHPTVFHQF